MRGDEKNDVAWVASQLHWGFRALCLHSICPVQDTASSPNVIPNFNYLAFYCKFHHLALRMLRGKVSILVLFTEKLLDSCKYDSSHAIVLSEIKQKCSFIQLLCDAGCFLHQCCFSEVFPKQGFQNENYHFS